MGRGRHGEPRSRAPELGVFVEQEVHARGIDPGACFGDHVGPVGKHSRNCQHPCGTGYK